MGIFFLELPWARLGITPSSDLQMTAMFWLDEHFLAFGDHHPNDEQCSMSVPTKKEVWLEYSKECQELKLKYLTHAKFNELWNAIYPHNSLKPYINVSMSCNNLRSQTQVIY